MCPTNYVIKTSVWLESSAFKMRVKGWREKKKVRLESDLRDSVAGRVMAPKTPGSSSVEPGNVSFYTAKGKSVCRWD